MRKIKQSLNNNKKVSIMKKFSIGLVYSTFLHFCSLSCLWINCFFLSTMTCAQHNRCRFVSSIRWVIKRTCVSSVLPLHVRYARFHTYAYSAPPKIGDVNHLEILHMEINTRTNEQWAWRMRSLLYRVSMIAR